MSLILISRFIGYPMLIHLREPSTGSNSHAQSRVPHPEPQTPLSRLHALDQALTDTLEAIVHLGERLDLVRQRER